MENMQHRDPTIGLWDIDSILDNLERVAFTLSSNGVLGNPYVKSLTNKLKGEGERAIGVGKEITALYSDIMRKSELLLRKIAELRRRERSKRVVASYS